MEEIKKKTAVKAEGEKEPSQEQLKNWCNQLLTQRNQLAERLQQVTDVLNKLPWLFKVIEYKDTFSQEFVEKCVQEVQFIMSPPEEEDKDSKE